MNKQDNLLIEWTGCLWILVITGAVTGFVYVVFWPFVHAVIDFYELIPGF
jgi:hypothetical protein